MTFCGHDFMSMEAQYILNNYSYFDIIDFWMLPYYIQAAFGFESLLSTSDFMTSSLQEFTVMFHYPAVVTC